VLCLALLASGLYAQRYSFKRYDQESGLPSQSVRCLLQDRAGFLWVGTDNGLFRYDGHRFRGFTTDDGLPASQIQAIDQTGDGTLWVATLSGLARLNGERFEIVDISPGRGASAVASDSAGRLYVGAWNGLLIAESGGASPKPVFRMHTIPGAPSQVVRSIAISPNGQVWYACAKQLCRVEGGKGVSRAEWGVADDLWQSVAIDSHGSVWARSAAQLIELPKWENRFQRRDAGLPRTTAHATLFAGPDGQLWVPTIRGLARRTPAGWDVIGKSRGLPISSVHCVIEDREGSLWIGLNGGGVARSLGFPNWESWTEGEGLSSESVWSIRRDRAGVLWSASDTGVSRFDAAHQRWEDLKVPGLPAVQTVALDPAADGSLWVAQVTGAVRVDLRRGSARLYGQESGLQNPWITALAADPKNGVWACTPNGLYHSAGDGGAIRFVLQDLSLERGADFFFDCLVDRKGSLWMAAWGGLLRLENGRLTRFTTREGLLHNRVQHIVEGKDGSIWIGYADALGVSRLVLDGERPQWRHFSRPDGLRSLKVFFVGCDIRGWIWLGTDQGVDVFDGRVWRHFDHTDGLAWDDCDGNAFWADADGSVWMGTGRGISHFRIPAAGLPPRPTAAPAMLISALFGDRAAGLAGLVSVPWSQRSLDAGFTAMTFVNEDTVRFRYRIAGLEERWKETQLREVHLPGLPAGGYTFEVQANAGQQGAWDPVTARLAFTIRPAWWRTWWFDLAAVAAAAFLAKQLWAWRLRSILRRQKELEAAVADRTAHLETQKQEIARLFLESQQAARLKEEFLANMNHELRTPMNGIIGMTELALETALTEEQREYLQTVHSSSGSLLGIIDDILDFSNIEAGKMDLQAVVFDPRDVVSRAIRNLAARARQKNLELLQHIDRGVPDRLVGDPFRLRQVLINLLSNAVKFTERGKVSVRLVLDENAVEENAGEGYAPGALLHFEVADTGVGICREKQSLIFEPFSQADGSLTRCYGGAGLGLTICARFVEMMGGAIWVESEPGQGSRFHFTARFERSPEMDPVAAAQVSRRDRRSW